MAKTKIGLPVLLAFGLLMGAAGCASSLSPDVYSRDQARQVQRVREGEVVMVRDVQIEGTKSGVGAIAGGVLGFAVGQTVGSGSGRTLAGAAGAVGGAAAGTAAEEGITRQRGVEITVELADGEVVSIVQAADRQYQEGDKVKVLIRADGGARVIQ